MNRSTIALGACCLSAALLTACGGHSKPQASAPPSPEQMEKIMMEAGTPGPVHKMLMARVGTWDGKIKMWMAPGAPAEESTGTTTYTSFMDGRFLKNETHASMNMGGHTMPFDGFGVIGYNNTTKKVESTWCDSMGTMQMFFTGNLSSDQKRIELRSEFFCPMMKCNTYMREVETMTGPNTMMLEMFGPDMATGKEMKMMEIKYTKR
jgi:hypothetical protein